MKIIKHILVVLMLFFSTILFSQTYTYHTTAFAINEYTDYGWTGWSKWEYSNLLVTVNLDKNIIVINSPYKQIYSLTNVVGDGYDQDGEYNAVFKFIDQDYDRGTIRFIDRHSGVSEIYIEFSNVRWCYRIKVL